MKNQGRLCCNHRWANPRNRNGNLFRRLPRVERLEDRLLLAASPLEPGHGLGMAPERVADVDFVLTSPAPMNQLDISVTAEAFGNTRSDTDTAAVTGNTLAALGIEFDPATHQVTSVEELEFTGGTIYLSDVSLSLNYGSLVGRVEVSGTGVSGTVDTPQPPGTVTGETFNTAEHSIILNHGQFEIYGTGYIGGLFDPITIDLSAEPVEGTTAMTGHLDVHLETIAGGIATYQATMTLPVNFDQEVYNDGDIVATVAVTGTLESTGQFTRAVSDSAAIRGGKWNDLNGNAQWDAGEPGLAGWKIYLDENQNGHWDTGEQFQMTTAGGDYTLAGLLPGTYVVAEVPQAGWQPTTPASRTVVVASGQVVQNVNFGNRYSGSAANPLSTPGLYDPFAGTFHLKNSNTAGGGADVAFRYGPRNDRGWIPLVGDWNGDGVDTVGLYDPFQGVFHLKNVNASLPAGADLAFRYGPAGNPGWQPIIGDWNDDGIDTVGLYDPAGGAFHLKNVNANPPGGADVVFRFGPRGNRGWTAIVGDWDNNGIDTIGLYDPAGGAFHLKNSHSGSGGADAAFRYGPRGNHGWIPLAGDWNADGVESVGLYGPAPGGFYLKNINASPPAGADLAFRYGPRNSVWTPLTGDWDGVGGDGAGQEFSPGVLTPGALRPELAQRAAIRRALAEMDAAELMAAAVPRSTTDALAESRSDGRADSQRFWVMDIRPE